MCILEKRSETLCRHRNPLWCEELALSLPQNLAVDTLHAFHLGVLLLWCREALWFLMLGGIYGLAAWNDEGLAAVTQVVRKLLFKWCKQRKRDFPGETLTELNDLVPTMVGTHLHKKLKTKAAETWTIALFILDEYDRLKDHLHGVNRDRFPRAGRCLVSIMHVWHVHPWVLPKAAIKVL